MSLPLRLQEKIRPNDDGCWIWIGSRLGPDSYGRTSIAGRLWLAHRAVYTLLVGPIPVGLDIDHLCCVKPCVNPSHLEPVTRSENNRRGPQGEKTAAIELAKTHCPSGHPYDAANTYRTPKGSRKCRRCQAVANLKYDEAHRADRAAYGRAWRSLRALAAAASRDPVDAAIELPSLSGTN